MRKEKTCIVCGKKRVIWRKGMCKKCAAAFAPKKRSPVRKRRKRRPRSEIAKLDFVISQLVRLRSADEQGRVKCYTCDYTGFWKQGGIECGHYISRTRYATRFEFDGLRPQCLTCNHNLKSNHDVYRERLIQELGLPRVEELERLSKSGKRYTDDELKRLRFHLMKELQILKRALE